MKKLFLIIVLVVGCFLYLLAASPAGVVGAPSVTPAFINQVLAAYHSPANGLGQALYDDGIAQEIDPVYALAFFMHESTMGRYGWGYTNKSLGNIRCSAGYACQGGFRHYQTWEQGFKDWYKLIRTLYVNQLGLVTVEQIIPTYAPSSENNVQGYIDALNNAVAAWHTGRVLV